ncbi:MAG: hypothetical protein ACT4OK_11010 [Gemmobacter sp.]
MRLRHRRPEEQMNIEHGKTPEEEFQELEITIEQAKEAVETGKAAQRLYSNPDFKALIVDGYFLKEAARLALLHGDPGLRADIKGAVLDEMKGPGALKRYLSLLVQRGRAAEDEINQAREAMFELMNGDRDGEE